jgi:hypothetical protein
LASRLVEGRAAQVVDDGAEPLGDVVEQGIALGGAAHGAVRHAERELLEAALLVGDRGDRGVGKLEVDREPAVVDGLVELPQGELVRGVVPPRQAAVHFAHGLDVVHGVVQEPAPLDRMRVAGGAAQLQCPGRGRQKSRTRSLPTCSLALSWGTRRTVRERVERAGERVGVGLRHRAAPALEGRREKSGRCLAITGRSNWALWAHTRRPHRARSEARWAPRRLWHSYVHLAIVDRPGEKQELQSAT